MAGNVVKLKDGVLSGFTASSFALIDSVLPVDKTPLETVMEFETAEEVLETFGLMGGVGKGFGFTPFYVANSKVTGCLSSTGKTWDIANGFDTGILLRPKSIYRMRCIWDGVSFSWYDWQGKWVELRTLRCNARLSGGLKLQLGTNRGINRPFNGKINLNKCYIRIADKLWWEGVKGAYKNANK